MKTGRKIPRKDEELISDLNERYKDLDRPVHYMGKKNIPGIKSEFFYDEDRINVMLKCQQNVMYFAQHFFTITTLDYGKQLINLHPYQRDMLRLIRDNPRCIINASRQIGKTSVSTIYALWLVLFFDSKRVIIVANKADTAKEIFKRIKLAYEELPNWIKSNVTKWGETSFELENSGSVSISSTSKDAIRGISANCLDGDSLITIKNKNTGEIRKVGISDLLSDLYM